MLTSIIALAVIAGYEMFSLLRTAPIGYENERGFHFGIDPDLEF